MSTRTTPTTRPAPDRRQRAGGASRDAPEPTPRRSTPRVTVAAVLTALALGALLNGPGLVSAATGLDVGVVRTVALPAATLIADTGALLGTDRVHAWLSDLRDGRTTSPGVAADPRDVPAATTPPARAGSDLGAALPDEPATTPPGRADPAPIAATAATDHDRARRPVTAEAPLEVLLIGDSLIGTIADGFGRLTDGRDTIRSASDVRISTGLARPDVLDWHRHLDDQLAVHDPDVVVLMLGGNDDQSLTAGPDGVIHLGQDGWAAEYERRVADLLAIGGQGDRLVVWLGLPAVRPDKLERTRPTIQAAVERAIAGTDAVLLDTAPIVSPNGYTTRLDGEQVRAGDGVHLSQPGGELVATRLDQLLTELIDLPTG